jgi:hypothetical protein
MKTKFAIGCLVQWYEIEIIEEYLKSLTDAIDSAENEDIIIDLTFITNQDLEEIEGANMIDIISRWREILASLNNRGYNIRDRFEYRLHTIADYRRLFNANYCNDVDVLIWGESDALLPKQMFIILDNLHKTSLQNNNPKYLAFFGMCKMWDDSWKPLEHPDFTDKPFIEMDTKNWWSLRYTMNKDEMNKINDKTNELDVRIMPQHKFNGCGLVISSEVIKSGVNIPKSVFFVHEDSAFMFMTNKVLGNIPQYVIKNILLVHNRKHPNKRMYIKGEEGIDKTDPGAQRRTHKWYSIANKMCEENYRNLFNPNYKSFTWQNVFKEIK